MALFAETLRILLSNEHVSSGRSQSWLVGGCAGLMVDFLLRRRESSSLNLLLEMFWYFASWFFGFWGGALFWVVFGVVGCYCWFVLCVEESMGLAGFARCCAFFSDVWYKSRH